MKINNNLPKHFEIYHMTFFKWAAISALSASALLATSATAATMKTTFTGAVTVDSTPNTSGTSVGTAISFSTTYDPDLLSSTPESGGGEGPSERYTGDITAELIIGAHVWTFDTVDILVANNDFEFVGPNEDSDGYLFSFGNGNGPAAPFSGVGQILFSYNPDQFTDASFPTSFPLGNSLPDRPFGFLSTDFSASQSESILFSITGSTTVPVSAVPLPLSGLALITGLGGLGALRRKSRKTT